MWENFNKFLLVHLRFKTGITSSSSNFTSALKLCFLLLCNLNLRKKNLSWITFLPYLDVLGSHLSKHQSCVESINAFYDSKDLNVRVKIMNSDVHF